MRSDNKISSNIERPLEREEGYIIYKLSALPFLTLAVALSARLLVTFGGRFFGTLDYRAWWKRRIFPLHQPRSLWLDLFVVAFYDADFLEAVTLIESLSVAIGHLHVEVYGRKAGFRRDR